MKKNVLGNRPLGKIILTIILVVIIISVVTVIINVFKNRGVGFEEDYSVAVIDTQSSINSSELIYYDKDFNKVFSQKIDAGGIYSDSIVEFEDKIYAAPGGEWFDENCEYILEIDKETGRHHKYNTNRKAPVSIGVSDNNIVVVYYSGKDSILLKIDRKTEKITEKKFENILFDRVNVVQDKIYCFNSKDNLNSAGCTILDMENMNRVKNIEFADDEISYTFIKNDIIYMASAYADSYDRSYLHMYNIDSESMETLDLGEGSVNQITDYGNYLVITDVMKYKTDKNEVIICNLDDNSIFKCTVDSVPEYCVVHGDSVYLMDSSKNTIDIYKLNVSDSKLELLDSHVIKHKNSLGGFFVK